MYPGIEGQSQNILALLTAWGSTFEAWFDSSTQCPRLTSYIIELEEVRYHRKVFSLSTSVPLVLHEEEDGWCCENKETSSLTFGATAQEAVYSFCEEFAVLWNEIAEAPNEDLAPDAQRLKGVLKSLVRAVEER